MAEGDHGKGHFALRIDIEQVVHRIVDKATHDLGGQPQCSGYGQQVREQGAVVPAKMAIGTVLILPGIAPIGASADDGRRSMNDSGFTTRGFDQHAAIVSGTQFAQAELGRGEVINARRKIVEIPANQIKLDLVERTGTSCRAEIYFAARILSLPGYAGGKIEKLGDCF